MRFTIQDVSGAPGTTIEVAGVLTNTSGQEIDFAPISHILESLAGDTFAAADAGDAQGGFDPLIDDYTLYSGPLTTNSSLPYQGQFSDVKLLSGESFNFMAATIMLDSSIPVGGTFIF
jgi:hypothetical protein